MLCCFWLLLLLASLAKLALAEPSLLVTYSYYYSQPSSHPDEENLIFFAMSVTDNADSPHYLFLFVANDPVAAAKNFPRSSLYRLLPPRMFTMPNVQIRWVPNGYYDLCIYKTIFMKDWFSELIRNYTRFFFINATVRGPLVPHYVSAPWWEIFLGAMTDDVSLVGSYMNCEVAPHIQTFAFLVDSFGLQVANDTWFCPSADVRTKVEELGEWIGKNEIALTRNIVDKGRSFRTLLASHASVDGSSIGRSVPCSHTNPTFYDNYYGGYPSPYEVVFWKCGGDTSRHRSIPPLMSELMQIYTEAVTRTWDHEPARQHFLKLTSAWNTSNCPQPAPFVTAMCRFNDWMTASDFVVPPRLLLQNSLTVRGYFEVPRGVVLRVAVKPLSFVPLIKVEKVAILNGFLRYTDFPVERDVPVVCAERSLVWSSSGEVRIEKPNYRTLSRVIGNCLIVTAYPPSSALSLEHAGTINPFYFMLVLPFIAVVTAVCIRRRQGLANRRTATRDRRSSKYPDSWQY